MELSELSKLVDEFVAQRRDRLAADRVAAILKEKENVLKEEVIRELQLNNATLVGGSSGAVVKLQEKEKPVANDWSKLYAYIREHDAFDLLHKRITEGAVKLRQDDGIEIPGVEMFKVYDLTVSGVK